VADLPIPELVENGGGRSPCSRLGRRRWTVTRHSRCSVSSPRRCARSGTCDAAPIDLRLAAVSCW